MSTPDPEPKVKMRRLRWPEDKGTILAGRAGTDLLADMDAVRPILDEVRGHGDEALRDLTRRFDDVVLDALEIDAQGLQRAWERLDVQAQHDLDSARARITAFHARCMPKAMEEWDDQAGTLGRRAIPVPSAGVYVPGGRAAYPSSVLMNLAPALVAGVPRIIVCTPPSTDHGGRPAPATLAAIHCMARGTTAEVRVFAVGGAQAIFAMAVGTSSVPRVERISGPGNRYVAAAKALVAGFCPVDAPAGPSEVLVLADSTADPAFIAAEVLAQAEHDPDAVCGVACNDPALLDALADAVEQGAATAKRGQIISSALAHSLLIHCPDEDGLVAVADAFAAEHLSIQTQDPRRLLDRVHGYGSAFLGPHSPVAAGDYLTGPNHVLPTAGMAARWSPLGVDHFLLRPTHQRLTAPGIQGLAPVARRLAEMEGLHAHAQSLRRQEGA